MGIVDYWPILILAVAISVDGFAVGVTYGLRSIKLGILPLLIVSGLSTIAIYLTCTLGAGMAGIMGKEFAQVLGSIFLVLLGIWMFYSSYRNYNRVEEDERDEKVLFFLSIKSLGIIIKILKKPVKADLDSSGSINISEAIFLGLALALDALGVGLGTGLVGFSSFIIPMVIGISTLFFVGGGYMLGKKAENVLPDYFDLFPGIFVIMLGIINYISQL